MNPLRASLRYLAELFLFCGGLLMLIPPMASQAGATYPLAPRLWLGDLIFGASLLLSRQRQAEHWPGIVVKCLCYLLLGWLIGQRVSFC